MTRRETESDRVEEDADEDEEAMSVLPALELVDMILQDKRRCPRSRVLEAIGLTKSASGLEVTYR